MNKQEITNLLQNKGFLPFRTLFWKRGGIEVIAERRIPIFEFDYDEFVFKVLEGKVEKNKIHFLDPWTFTIECE